MLVLIELVGMGVVSVRVGAGPQTGGRDMVKGGASSRYNNCTGFCILDDGASEKVLLVLGAAVVGL